jgi:cytochrome P450
MCLGNSLARLEIQIMFEDLLARDVDLMPNGKADYVYSNFVHGFKRLPVKKA